MTVIVAILATMVATSVGDRIHRARLARCFAELHNIQETLLVDMAVGNGMPAPQVLWDNHWHGAPPGPYFYVAD